MKIEFIIGLIVVVLVGTGLIILLSQPISVENATPISAENTTPNKMLNAPKSEKGEKYKEVVNPSGFVNTGDKAIKIADYVVVPTATRHGMTVVKVVDVDVRIGWNHRL